MSRRPHLRVVDGTPDPIEDPVDDEYDPVVDEMFGGLFDDMNRLLVASRYRIARIGDVDVEEGRYHELTLDEIGDLTGHRPNLGLVEERSLDSLAHCGRALYMRSDDHGLIRILRDPAIHGQ